MIDFAVNDWADIAALLSVIIASLGVLAWVIRRWIHEVFDKMVAEVKPHIVNDDTGAATYAHRAVQAACEAKEAALDAKEAALDARGAAIEARDAVRDLKKGLES